MRHPEGTQELIEQGHAAEREGCRAEARTLYEQALRRLPKDGSAASASALLRWIGRTHHGDGNSDAALDCLDAALVAAEASGDAAAVGHAVNLQAIVHWQCGRLDMAETLYTQARETALLCNEAGLAAMTAQNLGVIGNIRGDFDRALRFYRTSLAEFRSLGAAHELCVVLNNLGILHTNLEQWAEAAAALNEATQIAAVLGDVAARIQVAVNRAALQLARKEYVEARETCQWALSLSEQSQERQALGEIHKHLGTVSRELGELSRAEEHFDSAEATAMERGEPLLVAEIARERAELLRRFGRNREALQQLNRSHRLFSDLRAKRDIAEVDRHTAQLERYFLDVVRHWGESVESKDQYTQGHCERVADLACALAVRAGLASRELFWFRIGAMLHDVGKLVIPSEVLNKPGRLTEDEWALIRRHPAAGVEMLADVDFPEEIVSMVRSHHERWDGAGYPDQLAGDSIPRLARMLCVADVYDALTSRRSYKPAVDHERAMEIMRSASGRQFDPHLFALFEELMKTRQPAAMRNAVRGLPTHAAAIESVGPADDLTGLVMRRPFVDTASRLIAERGPLGRVSLMVIDVDEFKRINDSHGHLQGDRVLRAVASTLRDRVGSVGLVGRYAGDEFVVLLPQASAAESRAIAVDVGAVMRKTPIPLGETDHVFVTLSIGVAEIDPHGGDFEALFAAADRALYDAKRRGRDTVVSADEVPDELIDPLLNVKQFVGRQAESKKLVRLFESTLESGPAVVALIGEAGVGKSTLVRELTPELRLRAGSMVIGRSLEVAAKRPYAPWVEVIQGIEQLGIVPRQQWNELHRIVHGLGEATASSPADKYMLHEEIRTYLSLAAASRPMLVMLDDMQWADDASWDVLEYVLAGMAHARILFCCTLRGEDVQGPVRDRRRRLMRDERYHEIAVKRLGEAEVAKWVSQVFGQHEVDPAVHRLLFTYTEGNPLLTTQALRALVEDHRVRFTNGRWELVGGETIELPAAATGLLERRLERLSPHALRVLATAAVIGRTFDIDLVAAADVGSEDELLDAIDEGLANAILEPVPASNGSGYSFTHALLAVAAMRTVNPRRLARVHERFADTLSQRAPERAGDIALHYQRAGIRDRAFDAALRAGRAAMQLYAYPEARAFFALAVDMADEPDGRATARTRLAELAEAEGQYVEAAELCGLALDELQRTSGTGLLALRRMRVRIRASQGQDPRETIDACDALLDDAIEAGDGREEVALLGMISLAKGRLGEWLEAEFYARRAVSVAEPIDDSPLRASTLTRLGTALLDRAPAEATQCYTTALQLYREHRDRCGEARCCINLGIIHSRDGDTAAAESDYAVGLEVARAAHAADLTALAALNLGVLYLKSGRAELATERFEEALGLFTEARMEPHRVVTLYNIAHLARENGHWDDALTTYAQVATIAATTGQPDVELGARAGAGIAALVLGRVAIAEEHLRRAMGGAENKPGWWFQGRELVDALRVLMAAQHGDVRTATALFHEGYGAAVAHDLYAASWLAAECARKIADYDHGLEDLIASLLPQVEAHGFGGIASRLAATRLAIQHCATTAA